MNTMSFDMNQSTFIVENFDCDMHKYCHSEGVYTHDLLSKPTKKRLRTEKKAAHNTEPLNRKLKHIKKQIISLLLYL